MIHDNIFLQWQPAMAGKSHSCGYGLTPVCCKVHWTPYRLFRSYMAVLGYTLSLSLSLVPSLSRLDSLLVFCFACWSWRSSAPSFIPSKVNPFSFFFYFSLLQYLFGLELSCLFFLLYFCVCIAYVFEDVKKNLN